MSHKTIAAVRQYEMNENITLLTTIVCAARLNFRPDQEPPESKEDDMTHFAGSLRHTNAAGDLRHLTSAISSRAIRSDFGERIGAPRSERRKCPFKSESGYAPEPADEVS